MSAENQPVPAEAVASRIAAIVLAADCSSRMAKFKPMLPLAGSTALEHCIRLFRAAGVGEVIAILGHRAAELQPLAERAGARCIHNPHYKQGMFSSITAGSRALANGVEAAFVLPAEIPLVRPHTIRRMASVFVTRRDGIVYPVFEGHRGYPPLIGRKLLNEAARDGVTGSLFDLLARHENEAINLCVADQCIHMDMDTPANYEALCDLAACRDIPTRAECEAILVMQPVAPSQVRHSRRVAEVAERIARALERSGLPVNVELARAGALLHDMAKGQLNHAAVGAEILRSMDFPRVATVVAAHTELDFSGGQLDERAIVYLADKLVRGENLATLEQRFQPALARFSDNPAALHAVQGRMATAQAVALAVERRLGAPLASVVGEAGKP